HRSGGREADRRPDRDRHSRPLRRSQPALAVREGEVARAAARGLGELRQSQCPRRRRLRGQAARQLRQSQACRPQGGAGPSRGVFRRIDAGRQRAWPPKHARDPALFGGRRGPDHVACRARRGAWHGLGLDPRSGRGHAWLIVGRAATETVRVARLIAILLPSGLGLLVAAIVLSALPANATERTRGPTTYSSSYVYTDHPSRVASGRIIALYIDRDFD